MDLKKVRSKLIGNDENRAVSPVIGVILMVAITVILAATIAAFVMDMGQSQSEPVQAAVDVEVSNANGEVTFTVTDMGNAKSFEVRGDSAAMSGSQIKLGGLSGTGDAQTISDATGGKSGADGNTFKDSAEGQLSVVGINGDEETTVATFEVDFDAP